MTSASKSVYYFGFYLLITGITLTVAPNMLLSIFQIATTNEIWIRVLGAVVFGVGMFYVFMAPANHLLFLTLTVYARISILIWFSIFVVIGWAPAQLLIFGLLDGAGATWTYLNLRKQSN
jgi:hypothetical protein